MHTFVSPDPQEVYSGRGLGTGEFNELVACLHLYLVQLEYRSSGEVNQFHIQVKVAIGNHLDADQLVAGGRIGHHLDTSEAFNAFYG